MSGATSGLDSTHLDRASLDRSFAIGVGKRITQVRKQAGREQGDVAEALGYSPSTISAWERGSREPGLRALAELARYLETSVEAFFPSADQGWAEPVESPAQRLARVERQIRTLRGEVYAAHDHLRSDGLLPA